MDGWMEADGWTDGGWRKVDGWIDDEWTER